MFSVGIDCQLVGLCILYVWKYCLDNCRPIRCDGSLLSRSQPKHWCDVRESVRLFDELMGEIDLLPCTITSGSGTSVLSRVFNDWDSCLTARSLALAQAGMVCVVTCPWCVPISNQLQWDADRLPYCITHTI